MAFNPKSQYDTIRTNQAIADYYDFPEDYETRPPYQRKVVWDTGKQQALMDSLFRPWINGGETQAWNGQVLCAPCNQAKGASYDG